MEGIIQQIRMAETISKVRAIANFDSMTYSYFRDSYFWATLGCARALWIDHLVGSFEIWKKFDAIIGDLSSMPDVYTEDETPEGLFVSKEDRVTRDFLLLPF